MGAVDYVLCTHGHFDHFADAIPLLQETGATLIATFEIVSFAETRGIANGHPLHIGGGYDFPFGRVKMTPAVHGGQVHGDTTGQFTTIPGGFLMHLDGKRVYHAGDTALTLDMQLLRGKVDVAILPIGDNFTMGPEDAVEAVGFIEPRVVIPVHYNTWPLIEQDPDSLRRSRGGARARRDHAAGGRVRPVTGISWRIVADGALSGAANMARDHAIAAALRPGTGTLRLYRWSPATLSLGRNEPFTEGYRDLLRLHPEMGVVRRPTGGRAVIHDREADLCGGAAGTGVRGPAAGLPQGEPGCRGGIAAPGRRGGGGRGNGIAAGCRTLLSGAGRRRRSWCGAANWWEARRCASGGRCSSTGPCCWRRIRGRCWRGRGGMEGRASGNGGPGGHRGMPGGAITLTEVLGEAPPWEQLVDAFSRGFARALGGDWAWGTLTDEEQTLASEVQYRYGAKAWTWRRTGQG